MFFKRIILKISLLFTICQCDWNTPPAQDTLVFAVGESPKTLDPRRATDATGSRMSQLVFSGLVKLDEDLNLVGDLAAAWSFKDKEYLFKLKPQIYFHNGDKLRKKDLDFSFKQFRKKSSPFSTPLEVISEVSAEYDFSKGGLLKIKLNKISPSFLLNLRQIKILPSRLIQRSPNQFKQKPVGTGPFKIKSIGSHQIELVRSKKFFDELPKIKNLTFKVIKDATTRFFKMYKGQIDVVQSDIPFSKIDFFKKDKEFEIITRPGLSTTYLLINTQKDPLDEVRFRQALKQSLNVEEIIHYSLNGYAEPANSLIPVALSGQIQKLKAPKKFRDKELENLLGNERIQIKTSNNFQALENGQIIAEQLNKQGMKVDIKSFEWGTYYGDVKAGRFDIAIMKWVGVLDPEIYRNTLHSREFPPGRNRGRYENLNFDRLVDQAIFEADDNKRKTLYHRAQQIVFTEKPVIPLWHEKQVAIINKRVKNYVLPLDGSFSSLTKVFKANE